MIYLLHFERPIVTPTGRRIQHYLGYAADTERRLEEHRKTTWVPFTDPVVYEGQVVDRGESVGPGANLMGYVNSLGIDWALVMIEDGGRDREAKLKARKSHAALCPLCREERQAYNRKCAKKGAKHG